jgi:hypothetical protein
VFRLHIDNLYHPLESVNSFYFSQSVVEVKLMDEAADSTASIEKAKNGREIFSDKIADEIVAACGSGFTLEKAGALVGVNPSTIRTWAQRKPDFARRVETSRKKHELSLLRDIELAGAKSWQAKAWMAERIYHHAIPSARLQVSQDVTHGISGNLAQLLAGIAGRKREKKAEVIDLKESKYNTSSATNESNSIEATSSYQRVSNATISIHKQTLPKLRHKRMKLRKPRAESLAKYPPTTTPPASPPAPV